MQPANLSAACMRRLRGVTILELMICLVILTGVIIVFATVFPSGYRLGLANLYQNKAASLASAVLEEVKALPFADISFDNQEQSETMSVAAFFPVANEQGGWPGVTVTHTGPTQVAFTNNANDAPVAFFPHTPITVGTPNPTAQGDLGVFTLPINASDTAAGVTGIDVQVVAVSPINGAVLTMPVVTTPNIMTATIRVTVAWRETRQAVSQNKSVTLTGYVSRNSSQ